MFWVRQEAARDAVWLRDILGDVRRALRQLRRRPGFAAAAVATLTLGIGVNAAVFSLANWIVWRPVPGVADPAGLVIVDFRNERGFPGPLSYPNLDDLRQQVTSLLHLAAYTTGPGPIAIHVEGQLPSYHRAVFVTSNYFDVLGTRLTLGRAFTPGEELDAAQLPAVVVSHRLWVTRFGADSATIGRYFILNGMRAVVVGVAPAGFHGTEVFGDADLWVPGAALWALASGGRPSVSPFLRNIKMFDQVVARLKPGISVPQAEAELRAVITGLVEVYPSQNEGWSTLRLRIFSGVGVPTAARESVRQALALLAGVAGLVLVIACANVANLFLFRGVTRREELAVRKALGASRARLIGSQLTESIAVAVLASGPALLLATLVASLFRGPLFAGLNDVSPVDLDWRVLGFTLAIASAAGAAFGLLPGIAAVRTDPLPELKAAATRVSAPRSRSRSALATLQLSVSVALVVVTLLLVGTLRNLQKIDVGFDADRVVNFAIWPPYSGYSRERSQRVLVDVLDRIRSIPGVEDASLSSTTPFASILFALGDRIRAAGGDSGIAVTTAWISPSHFRTMGIPILAGRGFHDGEVFVTTRDREGIAVLSRALARDLFGDRAAVGQTIVTGFPDGPSRVIGVAGDSRWSSLRDAGRGPTLYQPLPRGIEGGSILVRSALSLETLQPAVQEAVAAVAPSVPVFDVMRLRDRIDRTLAQERLLAKVLTVFSILAVALASVGVYGVVAFSVADRTRELGVRVALGARAGQVVRLVVGQGLRLAGLGLIFGGAGAVLLSRLVESKLYGVSSSEPLAYILAASLLFAAVLAASALPARAATRVDPMVALRAE